MNFSAKIQLFLFPGQQHQHHQEAISSIAATLTQMNLAGSGQPQPQQPPTQPPNQYNGSNTAGWPAPSPRQPQWQENAPPPMHAPPSAPMHAHPVPNWQVGDGCLAKYWEDNKFYPVKVTAVSSKTAVVLFTDYGNHEEVLLSDLLPFPHRRPMPHHQPPPPTGYIPATAGLPPAFPQS